MLKELNPKYRFRLPPEEIERRVLMLVWLQMGHVRGTLRVRNTTHGHHRIELANAFCGEQNITKEFHWLLHYRWVWIDMQATDNFLKLTKRGQEVLAKFAAI